MSITVVFAGLMVVCLKDDPTCPNRDPMMNTAYVVKAYAQGDTKPCGWESKGDNETRFLVRFDPNEVNLATSADFEPYCKSNVLDRATGKNVTECDLSYLFGSDLTLCPTSSAAINKVNVYLPSLKAIDDRFQRFNQAYLNDTSLVPSILRFPMADISSSPYWPRSCYECKDKDPIEWFKYQRLSDSSYPPRNLSDRLLAKYDGTTLDLVRGQCKTGENIFSLSASAPGANVEVKFLNQARSLTATPDPKKVYSELDYLLWYYRLADWKDGKCPDYTQASILRCRTGDCYNCGPNKDTTYWPVMRP